MTVTVTVAPGHWLAPGPAAALLAALAAGMPLDITDAGRTRDEQQKLWDKQGHLGLAAHPDDPKAFHMTGEAVDLGPAATAWLLRHPEYGFRRTIKIEWWHWQWFAALATYQEDDVQLTDPLLKYTNPKTGKVYETAEAIAVGANYSVYTWDIVRDLKAMIANLVGAVAALAGGEDFDEAKLLAGIEASATAGAQKGAAAALAELETIVRDVAGLNAEELLDALRARLGPPPTSP